MTQLPCTPTLAYSRQHTRSSGNTTLRGKNLVRLFIRTVWLHAPQNLAPHHPQYGLCSTVLSGTPTDQMMFINNMSQFLAWPLILPLPSQLLLQMRYILLSPLTPTLTATTTADSVPTTATTADSVPTASQPPNE